MPEYSTGISQPPNSTILAPRALWTALSAVCLSVTADVAAKPAPLPRNSRLCQANTGLRKRSRYRAVRQCPKFEGHSKASLGQSDPERICTSHVERQNLM